MGAEKHAEKGKQDTGDIDWEKTPIPFKGKMDGIKAIFFRINRMTKDKATENQKKINS